MTSTVDIDWVVISLKRTPERLAAFHANNPHAEIAVEVLEAVDGRQLDREELVRAGLASPDLDWSAGAIGAALSQRKCWERAVESGRPVGIFEDDAMLRSDFWDNAASALAALPADWDTVHFGFNTDAPMEVEMLPGTRLRGRFDVAYPTREASRRFVAASGQTAPQRMHNVFGTCAYAVSPKGARKLLERCSPLAGGEVFIPLFNAFVVVSSLDFRLNGLYSEMSSFVCLPPIAMSPNEKKDSTIW